MVLADADLRNPSSQTLELMRERDRWAGRLLDSTAFLDSLRTRSAALKHQDSETGERLADLRSHIAALEEEQEL